MSYEMQLTAAPLSANADILEELIRISTRETISRFITPSCEYNNIILDLNSSRVLSLRNPSLQVPYHLSRLFGWFWTDISFYFFHAI